MEYTPHFGTGLGFIDRGGLCLGRAGDIAGSRYGRQGLQWALWFVFGSEPPKFQVDDDDPLVLITRVVGGSTAIKSIYCLKTALVVVKPANRPIVGPVMPK